MLKKLWCFFLCVRLVIRLLGYFLKKFYKGLGEIQEINVASHVLAQAGVFLAISNNLVVSLQPLTCQDFEFHPNSRKNFWCIKSVEPKNDISTLDIRLLKRVAPCYVVFSNQFQTDVWNYWLSEIVYLNPNVALKTIFWRFLKFQEMNFWQEKQ